jgi:GNAT superfamily N-acetyltransferase
LTNGALPSLRAATADDEPFLRRLYGETRISEFASLPLSEAQVTALCDAQFDAQAAGYRSAYPGATHFVVCSEGASVGRMIVAADARQLLLVDLCLMSAFRGRGWGRLLVRGLQDQARASAVPLRLQVERSSTVLGWYRELGFVVSGAEGTHISMSWTPP